MINVLAVGVGGFVGSALRYLLSGYVQQATRSAWFPFGTLTVNLTGCLLIGVLSHLADTRGLFSTEMRAFVFMGLLGGFTTFSTFGNETLRLLRDGENVFAIANVGAHVFLGLGAVWLGSVLAHVIWR
jgi:CrcB protein